MAKVLYKPHTWIANEHITTNDLNNIENGIIDIYAIDEDLEKADNRVTTGILTEDNTHTQYPSMKVVWDSFQKVGEDNLTQYIGLNSASQSLMEIQCYYDDKITIKNLNDIYLVDENNNLTNKKVPLSELINIYFRFSPTINGLSSDITRSDGIHFEYIEPNTGKIISNINDVQGYHLCARPPRKMEFVSLNENDTIYQNGDTLTINEIRDNLIFYAQDGYEWTYEQDGQTKKYADFLNDSDFSFENGEQSIQLQITDDNALSESQSLTINCYKTYGPSNFLQTINFSINVPIIVNRTQISNVRLYTPPTQRVYLKGKDEKAVYNGLQLQLIDENNNVWSSNNYPNGIIPFSELSITNLNISSLTQEEDTETYHGYNITWTSPSLVDENNTPITMSISVGNDNQDYRLMVSTYYAKTMEIDTTNATTNYNSGDAISKTGLNIVIKDSRGQPYIGLTNGKPDNIDILINPTVATISEDKEYGESEVQYVTVSWIDFYNNNNNKIENSYQITVKKPYKPWSEYSQQDAIAILRDIQNNKITVEQLNTKNGNGNIYYNTDTSFLYYKGVKYVYLLPNTNNYFISTEGEIKAILVFKCDTGHISNSVSSSSSWPNCHLQQWANSTFLEALPSELQQLLKPVSLFSSDYVNGVNITNNKINLFSIFEILGDVNFKNISNIKNTAAIETEHNRINTPFFTTKKQFWDDLRLNNPSISAWTRTGVYYDNTKSFIIANYYSSYVTSSPSSTNASNICLFAAI